MTDGRVYTAWADFRTSAGESRIYVSRLDFLSGITVRPASRDFGSVEAGKAKRRRILVANNGTEEVRILALRIRGPARADFDLLAKRDRCSDTILAPSKSCRFRVRFRPTSKGAKEATVVIRSTSRGQRRIRVPLLGTAIPAG